MLLFRRAVRTLRLNPNRMRMIREELMKIAVGVMALANFLLVACSGPQGGLVNIQRQHPIRVIN